MATIKIKSGLEANRSAITPLVGELLYTTDTQKVYIGDNSTAGGIPINQTSAEILTKILTVDGPSSGLDGDLIDGILGSNLLRSDQDGTLTGELTVNDKIFSAITQTPNSNTIVDVFLYDTTKDSDGGAWRKRTSHTSWYNETLDTATRGSTKEFPVIALIVSEYNKITIYDATKSGYPMWMVFHAAGPWVSWTDNSLNIIAGNWSIETTKMLNGLFVTSKTNGGMYEINFISEYSTTRFNNEYKLYNSNIKDRNNQSGYEINAGDINDLIINNIINDLDMVVLDNAPIDTETGLPIPTIAVATDGGVSIIHNGGSVVDITADGNSNVFGVEFNGDRLLWSGQRGDVSNNNRAFFTIDIPYADVTAVDYLSIPNVNVFADSSQDATIPTELPYISSLSFLFSELIVERDKFYAGIDGLKYLDEDLDDYTKSGVFYTEQHTISGWMYGDIKGSFLNSTSSNNLISGTELVTNGEFTSDVTGWTSSSGTIGWDSGSGGRALCTSIVGERLCGYASISTVVGQEYFVILDTTGGTTEARIGIGIHTTGNNLLYKIIQDGITEHSFVAQTSTTYINLRTKNTASTAYFNSISIRLGASDVSHFHKGLKTAGTITKTAVEPGAELMAYSGFSATNYLEQQYNSNLDFGTDPFYAMAWVKGIPTGATHYIFDRSDVSGDNRITLLFNSSGLPYFYSRDTATSQYISSKFGDLSLRSDWFFICAKRQSNGIIEIIINDYDSDISEVLPVRNIIGNNQPLNVGTRYNYVSPMDGSMSLVRIGKGEPSTKQIKNVYETERHLFKENAKCTLTSNSGPDINALSYDKDTNLLYVAGEDNLDTFDGLIRVDSEVGAYTSLSTVNGIVAKGN